MLFCVKHVNILMHSDVQGRVRGPRNDAGRSGRDADQDRGAVYRVLRLHGQPAGSPGAQNAEDFGESE